MVNENAAISWWEEPESDVLTLEDMSRKQHPMCKTIPAESGSSHQTVSSLPPTINLDDDITLLKSHCDLELDHKEGSVIESDNTKDPDRPTSFLNMWVNCSFRL